MINSLGEPLKWWCRQVMHIWGDSNCLETSGDEYWEGSKLRPEKFHWHRVHCNEAGWSKTQFFVIVPSLFMSNMILDQTALSTYDAKPKICALLTGLLEICTGRLSPCDAFRGNDENKGHRRQLLVISSILQFFELETQFNVPKRAQKGLLH